MKITSSYKIELRHMGRRTFQPTVEIYRAAVSYLVSVCEKEWDAISAIEKPKERFNFTEKLIHGTKKNTAMYDFDGRFVKMPSYLRRAAVQAALGAVASYRSLHKIWEENGKSGAEPRLVLKRNAMPVFYKNGMYKPGDTPDTAYLKLFRNGDWVWIPVRLLPTDVRYLQRHWSHVKASAPTLEYHYGKYYLRFTFEEQTTLSTTPVSEQKICAVDLGLNSDAVCSIMCSDGTVLDRKFIDFPSEKDQLYTVLNRIKRFQREHGPKDAGGFWNYAKHLNDELAKKIANSIVAYASQRSVDCIVFEYLDFKGKKLRGSKKQRLAMWKKDSIQNLVEHDAHRCGIRISHVCAWGTSRLAYDGSGALVRDEDNHAWATFATGKRYNCDLSASYNIGARYFVRELTKPLPERARSQLEAEVPAAGRRTSCTLSDLWKLSTVLQQYSSAVAS